MANGVLMPKQGITVESCILTSWNIKVGDVVKKGDILFSYETDKSAFEQESEFDGEVLAIFCEEGDEVPVLTNVCVIGNKGEDFSSLVPENAKASDSAPTSTPEQPIAEVPTPVATVNTQVEREDNDGRIFASPRAKNLAEKLGVDLSSATPTGPNGRIIESDVRIASTSAKQEQTTKGCAKKSYTMEDFKKFTDQKMPNIRKVIAKGMMNSLSSMAQLTMNISFDCTNILEFRKFIKANAEKLNLPSITINHIIIYALSRVLKNHKDLNAHLLNGDMMRYFEHVNMGIATDTPRGLLVPTLFGADTMTLSEIAVNSKKLSNQAIEGGISPELLSGGTFTVSNVGTMGIESFTPVINPPQTAILGVCAMETKVKLDKNDKIVPYSAMTLSLTFDHRATDGAPAGRFLKELKEYLENFSLNLLTDSGNI